MRTRGRVSAAESSIVVAGNFGPRRPPPPKNLTESQADIWRAVTASEDPGFFATGATQMQLADFCRHRDTADQVGELVNQSLKRSWKRQDPRAIARLQQLLRMRDAETRAASALARSLRLTNQSRYFDRSAARTGAKTPTGPAPWEDEEP